MKPTTFSLATALLALCAGCSDFWGEGPDPARAGPYLGEGGPSSAGSGSNGGSSNGGSNSGVSGSGQGCEVPPCPGSGGSGQVGTVLASDLGNNVNAIALDDEFVYFTTNQGLARVPKEGGDAEPLGGFNGVNGLAVTVGYVYLVEGSGAVTRVFAGGGEPETIVPATFGGGSGSIVVDATHMYYLVGPYLRRALLEGGTANDLTSDAYQGGISAHRLVIDETFAYYVASPTMGGQGSQLRKLRKDAPGGMTQPNTSASTLVAEANGVIPVVTSDDQAIYFADFGSDGLKVQIEIHKVTSGADKPTELIATMTPSGNNNNPGLGGDMVSDGDSIYFGGSGGIFKVSVEGGEIETIDEQTMTNAIAIDDRYLFWADQNQNGTLRRLEK
jgi:hypothetical protein